MKLLLNSTPTALWHDVIHDAEAACAIGLHEDVESYLVFLLVRYTNKPEVVKQIIATEFLQGMNLSSRHREAALQEVGDKCLLFSGLFPNMSVKRHVKIGYFVNLGQAAYGVISKKNNDIYSTLAQQFIPLMDILQTIRRYSVEHPDLLPMQAYELWNETGSQRAFSILKQYSSATPIRIIDKD